MKVLIVNKFLHPNGGSETYIFKLGEQLKRMGHAVEFFGMEHDGRIVGNRMESYTSDMDFHTGRLKKIFYPFQIIYSVEARKKLRPVLEDFHPDVVHLNNFNFQLTPSIIYEIRNYEKKIEKKIKIVYTAHDSQLVCPNHLMMQPDHTLCTKCIGGSAFNCSKYRCIHGSFVKSLLGSLEAVIYRMNHVYREIDVVIAPSEFMKDRLAYSRDLADKIVVKHNFVDVLPQNISDNVEPYVLYFGRYSQEKGVETLLRAAEQLPEIPFVFAGSGPLETMVNEKRNIKNKGFLGGEELYRVIANASFCIIPSECYENCPFSVMESQLNKTPVIASGQGGIPELLKENETGELFEAGNVEQLTEKIKKLWENKETLQYYRKNCEHVYFKTVDEYCQELVELYEK